MYEVQGTLTPHPPPHPPKITTRTWPLSGVDTQNFYLTWEHLKSWGKPPGVVRGGVSQNKCRKWQRLKFKQHNLSISPNVQSTKNSTHNRVMFSQIAMGFKLFVARPGLHWHLQMKRKHGTGETHVQLGLSRNRLSLAIYGSFSFDWENLFGRRIKLALFFFAFFFGSGLGSLLFHCFSSSFHQFSNCFR